MPKKLPVPAAKNDNSVWNLFGPPPLLQGENLADFESLLDGLARDHKPADTMEHAWIWDIAILTWEIRRYRRCIAGLCTVNTVRGLGIVLGPHYGKSELPALVDRWAHREPEAIAYVDNLLKRAGLTMEDVMAQTLSVKINDIDRIEAIVMAKQAQRTAILREITRRRSEFGTALHKSVVEIEEGEFAEIGAQEGGASNAA